MNAHANAGEPPLERDSPLLRTRSKKLDRDRRLMVAIGAGGLALLCFAAVGRWSDASASVPPELRLGLPVGALVSGTLLALWGDVHTRGAAMLQLRSIRRDELAAAEALRQGSVRSARVGFQRLLPRVAVLGLYHAHVLAMYAACRFYEGATDEARAIFDEVQRSHWLDGPAGDVVLGWRILVHLVEGELDAAEALMAQCTNPQSTEVAELLLGAHRGEWGATCRRARSQILDDSLRPSTRWSAAVVGAYAAAPERGALPADAAAFASFLVENEAPAFAERNPAIRPFLPASARLESVANA